ncbi:hypothetical protein Pcinc_029974 [Petrolisthes cinctipes]|uniref:Uncharacterized protein n=1 Tax=Petrolisthes cinctipes TaxID=88211 RepID=A0AAE1EZQ1_PETCI|nr:hypothetical protein Pcinc_029974 [Petrolisthes cinctipes]
MAQASARAIIIVTFNIFRVLCRKYGVYLVIGVIIVVFQGYSGYYVLRLGSDEVENKLTHLTKERRDLNYGQEKSVLDVESRVYEPNDRGDADSRNKGGGEGVDVSSKELSKEWLGVEVPCPLRSKESLSAIRRANTNHCKTLIANISCQIQSGSFYPVRLQSYCPSNGK